MQKIPRVASLHLYPLKSARGTGVDRLVLDAFGSHGDRRFLVVNAEGEFLSQRSLPRLALIHPSLTDTELTLSTDGRAPLRVPRSPQGPSREVKIWKDRCLATDAGPEAAKWLSEYLGQPAALVHMPESSVRALDSTPAPSFGRAAFVDDFPFLVTTSESLAALNERLATPVPMDRFRPNIVLEGLDAFSEDGLGRFRIGSVIFRIIKRCGRCTVINTDQRTTERAIEPLATLASFRKIDGKVMFGSNAVHETLGEIQVGDPVERVS